MKTIYYLSLILMISQISASAADKLVFAHTTKERTIIYSCDIRTLERSEIFSDSKTRMKLLRRNGTIHGVDRITRIVGNVGFAVGTENSSKVGALYRLMLDGSNQSKKIADLESSSPIARIAVDNHSERIAYPSLVLDSLSKGEGNSYFTGNIVIHNATTGQITKRIDLLHRVGTKIVDFLEWGVSDRNLYLRYKSGGDSSFFCIDENGSFVGIANELMAVDGVIGQLSNGDLLTIHRELGHARVSIRAIDGRSRREFSVKHHGWHYELSADDKFLAIQTSENEIWVKDINSGEEKLIYKMKVDYFKEGLSLLGWMNVAK